MESEASTTARRSLPRWLPEITLVLVSVALGFGAAQYGEYRSDQTLAGRILRSLSRELEENRALLEPAVPFHEAWLNSLRAASPQPDQSGLDVWFATRPPLPSDVPTPFVTLRRSAWDAALASGTLGLLDYDLATALSEIYRTQDLVTENVNRLALGPLSQSTTFDPASGPAATRLLWLTLADIHAAEAVLLDLYRKHRASLDAATLGRP
jgi:hypothetical protein